MERIGRLWKIVILIAAGIGSVGFFAPFIELPSQPSPIQASPYRLLIGYDDIGVFDPELRNLPEDQRAVLLDKLNGQLGQETEWKQSVERKHPSRIPHGFLAVLLIAGIGAVAAVRRQLGMVGALLAMGGGLGATYGWLRVMVLQLHTRQAGLEASHLVWGASLLAVAGGLALLAGIGALIWSDPGGFVAPPMIRAQLARGDADVPLVVASGDDARVPKATLRR